MEAKKKGLARLGVTVGGRTNSRGRCTEIECFGPCGNPAADLRGWWAKQGNETVDIFTNRNKRLEQDRHVHKRGAVLREESALV